MRGVLAIAIMLSMVGAGCSAPSPDDAQARDASVGSSKPTHVLTAAVEPKAFESPTFSTPRLVSGGSPVIDGGEPSLWSHLDGTLYTAFPGCANGDQQTPVDRNGCAHGPVFRSDDSGATWHYLNDPATGQLNPETPNGNGENDVSVDADGAVYVSNLGGGINVQRSVDGGATWQHIGNVVPTEPDEPETRLSSDRNWMTSGAGGHVIVAWMGWHRDQPRAVAINTTFDGGVTWTGASYVSENIGWLGTVQMAPDGNTAYIPFTKRVAGDEFGLRVARSLDAGRTWRDMDTGIRVMASSQGGHWSGVLMAPALDVTGDGTVVYAWSQEVNDDTGTVNQGSRVYASWSRDGGTTWSSPYAISSSANAIMPWVTGGGGDRFAVNYYASIVPGDADYVGARWNVVVDVIDGAADGVPQTRTVVLDRDIHLGGLCARGTGCTPGSSRNLLDFFESDILPDGRLVVVWGADPPDNAFAVDIRFAVQDGGTPLFQAS